MICGQIATSCLAYFLNAYYTGKMLDYPITEQIQDLIPSLALAGIMGLGVYALKYAHIANQLALLSAQIMTGIVLYVGICYIFRISSFMEIIEMIKSKLFNFRYAD